MQINDTEIESQVGYGVHLVDVHTAILVGIVVLEDIVTQHLVTYVYILLGRHSHILTIVVITTAIEIGFYEHRAL